MASLFLLRGHKPPSVASHTSVTLNLALLMAMAQGNDQTFMLRQHQDGSLIPSLPVQKYRERDLTLESIALIDYLETGIDKQRKNTQPSHSRDTDNDSDTDDDESHTLENKRKVAVLTYSFRPQARRTSFESEERHALACLLAFTPWRVLQDLKTIQSSTLHLSQSFTTFSAAWEAKQQQKIATPTAIRFLEHTEDRWSRTFRAQDLNRERIAEEEVHFQDLPLSSPPPTIFANATDDTHTDNESDFDPLEHVRDPDDTDFWMRHETSHEPANFSGEPVSLDTIDQHIHDEGLPLTIFSQNTSILPVVESLGQVNLQELVHGFKKEPTVDKEQQHASQEQRLSQLPIRFMKIEELFLFIDDARNNCKFGTPPLQSFLQFRQENLQPGIPLETVISKTCTLPTCATVNEASQYFKCTEMQHLAFTKGAHMFLQALTVENNNENAKLDQQFLVLQGLPGTGKSRLIRALQAFAQSWGRPSAIGVYAVIGVAAVNIRGSTLASLLFSFRVHKCISENTKKHLASIKILIIDEMSVLRKEDLADLDVLFKRVTEQPKEPFGGVHVMVTGDLEQLPPVRGTYLFQPSISDTHEKAHRGYLLYRHMCESGVICLTENMRTGYEDYKTLQNNIRNGIWNEEIKQQIQSRVGACLPPPPPNDHEQFVPIMVVKNKTRQRLLTLALQKHSASCASENDLPIVISAHVQTSSKSRQHPLTPEQRQALRQLPDSETEKVVMVLPLYPGTTFLINHNVDVPAGLAQGTRCRLIAWPTFPPHTTFDCRVYNGARVRFPVRKLPDGNSEHVDPLYVLVETMSNDLHYVPRGQPTGLPPNVVALPMYTRKIVVNYSHLSAESEKKAVTLVTRQLPLRSATALTAYAIQGSEFPRAIIAETDAKSIYTHISRGTQGLEGIVFAQPLPVHFKLKPNVLVKTELARLYALHTETVKKFRAELEHRQQCFQSKDFKLTTAGKCIHVCLIDFIY